MSRSGLMHPPQPRECATSQREFLCQNFFSVRIKFSPGILPRFCFPAGFSLGTRKSVFSWWHPGKYRFLGGILAEIQGRNFSLEGSSWENGPPWQDPGGIPASAGNLGGIPVPILEGCYLTDTQWTLSPVQVFQFNTIEY